ncbi:MAG: PEP-CTERM sorting domain-containing protein [Pirellula sp.]
MKRLISSVVFAAMVSLSCVNAMAGTWLGNNRAGGINNGYFSSTNPTSGALNGSLSVTNFLFGNGSGAFLGATSNGTVFFDSSPNFDTFGNVLNDPYTFSSTAFGSFVGNVTVEQSSGTLSELTGVATRTIGFTGTFTPGNSAFYEGDMTSLTNTTLTLTFSRNSGGSINTGWSLDTSAAAAVPEPTSIAIFGLGAVGFAVRRFRRK